MQTAQVQISGIIEGFYGPPWTQAQRLEWIERLAVLGMTHYVWAAKAEPRHRSQWREPFTDHELDGFASLAAGSPDVAVGVALTPGAGADAEAIVAKLAPAVLRGASFVVLSCDDMPSLADGTLHRDLAHALLARLDVPVWVVPTHYCGTAPSPYLDALTDGLSAEIELMWTGVHVVNDEITSDDAARWGELIGRPPLLWDNTPVSDAVMAPSLHLGPLTGRDPALRTVLRGAVWNPMEHAIASVPTLASAAAWLRGDDTIDAWRRVVDEHGWHALASATAFADDAHWPGDDLDEATWRDLLAALPERADDVGLDEATQPWLDAARDGAALAADACALTGRSPSTSTSIRAIGLAHRWRTWQQRAVSTYGSGVRIRPMLTQDDRGEFVLRPGSVQQDSTPVDRAVRRALSLDE